MAFKMKGFPKHKGVKPKDNKERKEPTYEGTDEYRPEKDIPKKEFEERNVKKKVSPVEKTPVGPKAEVKKGGVKKGQGLEGSDIPLSPGFEDPVKIQKLQREGLVPGSQTFIKKKK